LCDEPPPDPDEEEKNLYCGLIHSLHDELSAAGTLHPGHQNLTQRNDLQRLIGQRNDLLNIRSRQKKCLEHFNGTQQQTNLTFDTVPDTLQKILGNFDDKWQRRARQFSTTTTTTTTKFAREISKIKNLKPLILSSQGQFKKQIIYEHNKFQAIKLNAIKTVLPEFYRKLQDEYDLMCKKIDEKSFESRYHLSREQNFERINKLQDKAKASLKESSSTVKTRPVFSWEKEMNEMKVLLNERKLFLQQCSRDSREKIFDAYDVVRKQYPTWKRNCKDIKQLQTSMEEELQEIEKHLERLNHWEQWIKGEMDRYEQWVTDQLNSREREALLILRDETRKVEQWAEKVNAVHRHQLDTMASLQTERHFLRKMSTDILNIKLDIKLEKAWLAYDFLFSTLQHLRKKTRNLLLNRADKEKDIDSWIERFNNDDMERLKLLAEWTAARTAECNSLLRELPSLHDCNSAPTLERFMSHFAHFVAENNVGGATTAPIRKSLAHRAVRKVGKWLGVKKSKKKKSSGIPDASRSLSLNLQYILQSFWQQQCQDQKKNFVECILDAEMWCRLPSLHEYDDIIRRENVLHSNPLTDKYFLERLKNRFRQSGSLGRSLQHFVHVCSDRLNVHTPNIDDVLPLKPTEAKEGQWMLSAVEETNGAVRVLPFEFIRSIQLNIQSNDGVLILTGFVDVKGSEELQIACQWQPSSANANEERKARTAIGDAIDLFKATSKYLCDTDCCVLITEPNSNNTDWISEWFTGRVSKNKDGTIVVDKMFDRSGTEEVLYWEVEQRLRPSAGVQPLRLPTPPPVPMPQPAPVVSRNRPDPEPSTMVVVNEIGDNHCLFRAVAHQVYGDPERHEEVREAACDWLNTEGRRKFSHLNMITNQYISHMRQEVWGGELEITAMEHIYRRNIRIRENGNWVNRGFLWENFDYSIRVERVGEIHYNSLSDPSDSDHWPLGHGSGSGGGGSGMALQWQH
jgi:hypothetical protein